MRLQSPTGFALVDLTGRDGSTGLLAQLDAGHADTLGEREPSAATQRRSGEGGAT